MSPSQNPMPNAVSDNAPNSVPNHKEIIRQE
jgi:hypothetical protein